MLRPGDRRQAGPGIGRPGARAVTLGPPPPAGAGTGGGAVIDKTTFYARCAGYKVRLRTALSGLTLSRVNWRGARATRGVAGGEGLWGGLAIGLGILATALVILAVAVYEGFIPASLVDNLTPTELGTLGFLSIAGAVGSYWAGQRDKNRRRHDG
jgi:hypothetical protein